VKNFAQGVELSKGIDDSEDIKKILMDLGVISVGGSIG
jgi:DNA-directed RNA polymerase subunit B"